MLSLILLPPGRPYHTQGATNLVRSGIRGTFLQRGGPGKCVKLAEQVSAWTLDTVRETCMTKVRGRRLFQEPSSGDIALATLLHKYVVWLRTMD
ncbi:MAG: hypothetical protein CMJ62_17220 [Planctomycetaceae bacterium]|nr:hypothetical protein [Planctomycetaceae bacterium]